VLARKWGKCASDRVRGHKREKYNKQIYNMREREDRDEGTVCLGSGN